MSLHSILSEVSDSVFSWLNSVMVYTKVTKKQLNSPFPSCHLSQFQHESKCKIFHMTMSLICMKMDAQVKHIFIRMVLHEDSFRHWGKRQLGNGLFIKFVKCIWEWNEKIATDRNPSHVPQCCCYLTDFQWSFSALQLHIFVLLQFHFIVWVHLSVAKNKLIVYFEAHNSC